MSEKSEDQSFARKLAAYAGSSMIFRIFRLGYAYVKPKFLEPAQLGIWNLLALIPKYAGYMHLGCMNALVYRYPRLVSEGRIDEANAVRSTVYRFSFYVQIFFAIGVTLFASFGGFEGEMQAGLYAVVLIVLLTWYYDMQLMTLKAEMRFDVITKANLIHSVALVIWGIPMVVLFKFYGVLASAILTQLTVITYLWRAHPLKERGAIDWGLLKSLIIEGFPVLVFSFGLVLMSTVDRFIIVGMLDVEALGFYAVALVAATFILLIPVSLRDMIEPEMMAKLVKEKPEEIWRNYFLMPLLNTAAQFPFLMGAAAFLSKGVLELVLPRYVASAEAAVFLCFGVYFMALVQVMRATLVANGWGMWGLPFQAVGAGVNVVVSWVLVNQGWGITGVAAASGLSFALVFLMLWGLIMRRGPYTGAEGMGHLVAIMGPFIWAVVMTVSLNMAEPFVGAPEWIGALVKLTLYTVGAYALILVMKRRYPMLRNPLKFKNRG